MNVMTLRFGEIEIDERKMIEMPDGMLGFPDRRFVILSPGNQVPFFWFQSLDSPELAFVVTDPASFVQGYDVNPTPYEYERIKLEQDAEVIILAVVTMASEVTKITLNLQGPVIVNPQKMLAKQIVLEEGKYGTKHPLFGSPLLSSPNEETALALSLEKIASICCKH
jgi:flagellar assembly factor FliW